MYAICASTAGMLAPEGRERSEPVESTFVLHLPLHYPEEFWFVCLVFKTKPHDLNAVGRLTENRNWVGKFGAHLSAVGMSR